MDDSHSDLTTNSKNVKLNLKSDLMRTRLVSLGDANVDFIAFTKSLPVKGEETHIQRLEMRAGGSAANFALAASRLDMDSSFIGKVGDDLFGRYLTRCFRDNNVDVSQLQTGDEDLTGMVFCVVTREGERTMFASPGINAYLHPNEVDEDYVKGADALHLSGYAFLRETQRSAALKALKAAKKGNLFISLDVGVLAPRKARNIIYSVLRSVNLIFLNDREARWLTGEGPTKAARELLRQGLEVVALKLGSEGCLVLTEQDQISIPAYAVKAVNSTGAGDAFDAGFILGLMEGWDLKKAARFANAVGALKVRKGLPNRREVEEFMKRRS